MKYILLVAMLISQLVCFSQIKNSGCYLRMVEPKSETLSFENDTVKVSFSFNSMNYFCDITVKNNSKEVISIDWDKFTMIMEGKSYPIIFDNTVMIKKDDPKGSNTIAPETTLSKSIAPTEYIELEMPLYNKGWVKKRGVQEIGFIIPIMCGETTKYYTCRISISLT